MRPLRSVRGFRGGVWLRRGYAFCRGVGGAGVLGSGALSWSYLRNRKHFMFFSLWRLFSAKNGPFCNKRAVFSLFVPPLSSFVDKKRTFLRIMGCLRGLCELFAVRWGAHKKSYVDMPKNLVKRAGRPWSAFKNEKFF